MSVNTVRGLLRSVVCRTLRKARYRLGSVTRHIVDSGPAALWTTPRATVCRGREIMIEPASGVNELIQRVRMAGHLLIWQHADDVTGTNTQIKWVVLP
jgi:hypothetical protein